MPNLAYPPFTLPSVPGLPYVPSTAGGYTVVIGGAPVNVIAGTLNVTNQIGQRSTGSLSIWTPPGVVYQFGTQVLVYDNIGALDYAGFTIKDKIRRTGERQGTGYLEHSITLMDNCYRADKRRVFQSYLAQTAGYIVNDLLGRYLAAEGVTATATSIATGPTITEVIWSGNKSVSEALTWLATQAGYWWNIDVNNVLWFQPYGGIPGPFTIDGSQIDAGVLGGLSCEFGNDMYVNTQYAKGAFAEKGSKSNQIHESFHGNSLTRNFTLSYPVNTVYQIKLNGVDVTALSATKGSSGASWYYAKGDAVIAQDPGQTVLAPGDTLDVYYTGRYPVLAVAKNPALITAQKAREGANSSGIVESTYINTKVHTLSAAFSIASALLAHYGADTTVLEFDTRTKGLQPGQMLTVNLPDFALNNKQMLVSSVNLGDQADGINIWFHVQCVGSPVESAQWQTYWQNLMNQSSDPSDFTDTQDTALAFLFASVFTRTRSIAISKLSVVCPIIGNSTIIGSSMIVC